MADLSPSATYGGILGMDAGLVASPANPVNAALGMISGNWLSTGLQVLGGIFGGSKTNVSKAAAGSQGLLNTSGWATGESSAEGAGLSSSQSFSAENLQNLPWYYWAAGTLIAVVIIKKAV